VPVLVAATNSRGLTPEKTLDRHLQELRDEGFLEFLGSGHYLLLDQPLDVESEELTDEAIDVSLRANKLRLGKVETGDQLSLARRRKGQDRIRALTREYYGSCCAVCDVADLGLLIASHIVAWAEGAEHRGDLSNVICLCRIHDALFEKGYWSLADDLGILKRPAPASRFLTFVLHQTERFRPPEVFSPAPRFLKAHRERFGFERG
jgi:putative restriction endonuclease